VTSCPPLQDLFLYLEGELGPYKARALEEHVERCGACREALAARRLLHEAFTTLPPFEVPADFARAVMDSLPETETVRGGWLAPLLAAVASLVVGLLGFNLLTGTSLSDVLVAVNRMAGAALSGLLPLAAKSLKLAVLLLQSATDLAEMLLAAAGSAARALGPRGLALLVGLGGAALLLALFGARRFFSQGEEP
jgi:anti-sigma factor RsiW